MSLRAIIAMLAFAIIVPATTVLSVYTLVAGRGSETWHRSDRELPPTDGSPFVGAWLRSGKMEISVARRVGDRYFEYNPDPRAQIDFFGMLPPVWWVESPGTALPSLRN